MTTNSEQGDALSTQEWLAEAQARCDRATSGPWQHTYKDCLYFMNSDFIDREGDGNGIGLVTADINQSNADLYASGDDMEFIAHAREDLPRALRLIGELVGQLREARAALTFYADEGRYEIDTEWRDEGTAVVAVYEDVEMRRDSGERARKALAALKENADE